jgi:ComF family protein
MLARLADTLRGATERLALPQRCLFCVAPRPREGICDECREHLPGRGAARCPVCANLSAAREVCGECLAQPPRFARVRATVSYRFPVDGAIQRLKYGAHLAAVRPLGSLLAEHLEEEAAPDLVIAMPMAAQRLRERGFNHAHELAVAVSARLRLELASQLCRRVRHVAPQAALPWKERSSNIRGAFACEADLSGARVAIVDDVVTTGATLNELASVLLERGAAQVEGWVVARTEKP